MPSVCIIAFGIIFFKEIMKIAIIKLPNINTPTSSVFQNLHGYWNPPECIISFWSTGCIIEYISDEDYIIKSEIIKNSYLETIFQFYRDNAL